jgi:hypothetical protein
LRREASREFAGFFWSEKLSAVAFVFNWGNGVNSLGIAKKGE